ncbi:MAG: hypothetical protein KBC81_02830 [Candidatus Pacebacteria bacterium]|nr:hypothetical protein [Candidatus Paceibacterota bacterium]
MKKLDNVTLFGLDDVDINRLIQAEEICTKDFEFAKIKLLTSLDSDNSHVVKIEPVKSIREYSEFILKKLNDYIDTDFVLLIQHDGFILNPDAWDDRFLEYDYVGAPLWKDGNYVVGNGGFSLRSKKLLEFLQKDENIFVPEISGEKYDLNEDWIICVQKREYLESKGIRFAPVDVAKKFSFESNEVDGADWTDQFGFHGLKWTDISKWLKAHPEYKIDNPLDSWALRVQRRINNKNRDKNL